jgi:uncharacterized damage-inducible protein DinB
MIVALSEMVVWAFFRRGTTAAGLRFFGGGGRILGMGHEFMTSYLKDALGVFHYYKRLGENAMAQCPEDKLCAEIDVQSNSIAIVVKHMVGNMRSRWTNFLSTDGEKPDRQRDTEFEAPLRGRGEILAMWESGWKLVFDAVTPLTEDDLEKTVTIRAEPHSVMQAINRQIAHYSYHVGQIVFLARHFAGSEWKTLTIPKRKPAEARGQA